MYFVRSTDSPRTIPASSKYLCILLTGLVFAGIASESKAALDTNTNGLSDVWEFLNSASGLTAAGDNDRDGFTNAQESAAGTNPLSGASIPQLGIEVNDGMLQAFWQTLPGKRYHIEVSETMATGSWQPLLTMDGTGEEAGVPQAAGDRRFYRMSIADIDTDNDGLTDWEELTLGFDPTTNRSHLVDTLDKPRVTSAFAATSTISVGLLDGDMREDWPDTGIIAIRRTGGLKPVTVNFTLASGPGFATRGTDYTMQSGNQITIPLGVREVWVEFTPVNDTTVEGTEAITFTLASGSYDIDTANTATVELNDAASLPSVKAAARFMIQAAFGPEQDGPDADLIPENLEPVVQSGYEAWITNQFDRPIGYLQPFTDWARDHASGMALYGNYKEFSWWHRVMGDLRPRPDAAATLTPDPLRQRLAFALSEILVASDRPEQLIVEQRGMANFYDLMVKHAFGNYRDLLFDVATHPVMGIYLSHLGNRKADPVNRIYPDENFAREVMQLFSIGLWKLNPDGTRMMDSQVPPQPIPTYNNGDITELARVFTGQSFGNNANFTMDPRDYTIPMKMWDAEHDCNPKTLIENLSLPLRTPSSGNTGTAGMADVNAAITNLFNHANVGPFIGRQLIQRLVTSNPSPEYIGRVSAAFANNGSGVRGDMKAVIRAILLDDEARNPANIDLPTWGRLREPFLRVVNMAKAFDAKSASGYFPLDQFTLDHMQDPMNAPSVFNFFLPAHSPPGPLTQLGLVAPEFQLINASSAITGPNYFWNAIGGSLHRWGNGTPDYNVYLQTDTELGMIVPAAAINQDVPSGNTVYDPDPLLRKLDLVLTGGTLSPQQFQIIREAILRVNPGTWEWHRERLRLAIYLIVTSPDFNVQR